MAPDISWMSSPRRTERCTAFVLRRRTGGAQVAPDISWMSSPRRTERCTAFVLSHRTGGAQGVPDLYWISSPTRTARPPQAFISELSHGTLMDDWATTCAPRTDCRREGRKDGRRKGTAEIHTTSTLTVGK